MSGLMTLCIAVLMTAFGCQSAYKSGSDSELMHSDAYAAATKRALRRSMLARPYIWRFSVFSLLI